MSTPRDVRPAVAIQVLFVLFGIVVAAFFPFATLFLSDKGLSAGDIGVVLALMAVARIVVNPVWGHLADTTLGRRRTLRVGSFGAALAALALVATGELVGIAVAAAAFAAFQAATGPNIDAIVLAHLGDGRMHDYGRIRAWESLSYAATCLVLGLLLEQVGVRWSMVAFAIASLAVVVWASFVPRDRPQRTHESGRLGTVGALFREAPRFWIFLLAQVLLWTGFNAAWNFIALKIKSGGGGPLLVGMGMALGGLIEVPTMRLSSPLSQKVGLRGAFLLGSTFYAVGFLLWGLIESPRVVSVLTVFEGLGFALLFTTSVVAIGRMVPPSLYSTGQSVTMMVGFGLGPIIGAGIGGFVYDSFGPVILYSAASALALSGGLVAWVALHERSFRRAEPTEPEPGAPPLGSDAGLAPAEP